MSRNLSVRFLGAFALVTLLSIQAPAEALTIELAKKCRQLATTAHPSARPGTRTGAQKAQNEYYQECVLRNGDMDGKPKADDKAK